MLPWLVYKKAFHFFIALHKQKKPPFLQTKSFSCAQALPCCPQTPSFSVLHLSFPPSHNLLSSKNTAVLSMFALTPYAVTPEPRTDSKPFRRCFVGKTGFDTCRRKALQNLFRQSFESSPESRGSQTSISLKHGRLAHVRSQFSLFRRSPTHKNLPLATFCTSERAFWLLFARRKK